MSAMQTLRFQLSPLHFCSPLLTQTPPTAEPLWSRTPRVKRATMNSPQARPSGGFLSRGFYIWIVMHWTAYAARFVWRKAVRHRGKLAIRKQKQKNGCLPCESPVELLVQEGCPQSDEVVPRDSFLHNHQHGRSTHGGSTRGRRGRRQCRAEVEK